GDPAHCPPDPESNIPVSSSLFLLLNITAKDVGYVGVLFLVVCDEGVFFALVLVEALVVKLHLLSSFDGLAQLLLVLRFSVGVFQRHELGLVGLRRDFAHRGARLGTPPGPPLHPLHPFRHTPAFRASDRCLIEVVKFCTAMGAQTLRTKLWL